MNNAPTPPPRARNDLLATPPRTGHSASFLPLQNWALSTDSQNPALYWATLHTAGSGVNTLSAAVLNELRQILDYLDTAQPVGLIITSGKDGSFVAGADIEEFKTLTTSEEAIALVQRGWTLFNRLAAVSYPTLALVKGACLGGGLELCLACQYRIAVDTPDTRLGLPEVLLGIVPAWGGMRRLPRLVGPQVALDMMLTGKSLDARRAKKIGIVDLAVATRVMVDSARGLVLSGRRAARASGMKALMNQRFIRPMVAHLARKQLSGKVRRDQYPAPYALIDFWQKTDGDPLKAKELLDGIVRSPTARNLVKVFFLQERLKALGKPTDEGAMPLNHVHVVGAGTMGGDIAAWCALRGLKVTLQDQGIDRLQPALARAGALFAKRLRDPYARRAAQDRLIPDPYGAGIAHADLVLEAIVEDLSAKHSLLCDIERRARPDAIIASNTSSLRVEELRSVMQRPQRLVGIHFFNPVALMPLVEVVEAEGVDRAILQRAWQFVRRIDKLPLPVKSAPGFLVNAVLAPYMLAAMRKVDAGMSPREIDQALLDFGMPMGPLTLADTVGLDIALAAGRSLVAADPTGVTHRRNIQADIKASDDRAHAALVPVVPRCLQSRVEVGHLGKKTGLGFYTWKDGKATGPGILPRVHQRPVSDTAQALALELVAPLVARTQELVASGLVADADLADAGVIFGAGFAPFRGGATWAGEAPQG
jgi:3-hydroxyacyl-CoA dehydrogenase/enoyl-CoA hydratase/3-hydroxybutyryl-CoA epimerase